jgi:hypothetical protein
MAKPSLPAQPEPRAAGKFLGSAVRGAVLLVCAGLLAASDAYLPWSQGRPAESVAPLLQQAQRSDAWHAWLDAGLAAEAAGRPALATACFLRARQREPAETAPALAVRGGGPALWSDSLGPVADVAAGWWGLVLASLGGVALGWGLAGGRRRGQALLSGGAVLVLVLPGLVARLHDGQQHWLVLQRDSVLSEPGGAQLQPLSAGAWLQPQEAPPWNGRRLAVAPDGTRGWVPLDDVVDSGQPETWPAALTAP